jgi:predicted AAA+ superfamily ATPase
MTKKTNQRIIPVEKTLKRKGILLLGPGRTGKSYFIKLQLKPDRIINLLDSETFRKLSARPELLRELIRETDKVVAIDEIQKLPNLIAGWVKKLHLPLSQPKILDILTSSISFNSDLFLRFMVQKILEMSCESTRVST